MTDKVQRWLVEFSRVFEDDIEDDGPLTGLGIDTWIHEEAAHGNFEVVKDVIEDYGDTYKPLYCMPRGCEDCSDRLACIARKPNTKEE